MYLNCHSYFSLKYGTLSPQELWEEARRYGVRKLALTDINNTSAYIELYRICRENQDVYPLEIAIGIEFRQHDNLLYIGLACNNEGLRELCGYLSYHNEKGTPLLSRAPEFTNAFIIYPWGIVPPEALRENEFTGVRVQDIPRLSRSPYRDFTHKLVVWHPVTFKHKTGFNIHRLLRAIDHNALLSKLDPALQAHPGEKMMPENELLAYYWQYPHIIANTQSILEQCHIDIELGIPKNKKVYGKSQREDHEHLRTLALEGFTKRYETYNSYAMQRLRRELDVIAERRFEAYFLISWDIVQYAQRKNYAYVGRGSGANSMVAFCLGITEVDPIELDLYFERFLNPYRSAPPDFDIDFSWKDRDDVTSYVLNKYQKQHAALLAAHNTFQGKAVLRELGKVFGLPKNEIDRLIDHPPTPESGQTRPQDEIMQLIFRYSHKLVDFPANLSIHAGGIIISEAPIYAYTATDLPPKGFPITHFDMYGAEDIGLHKFDILSQRGLGHIKDTVALIEQNKGEKVDITQTTRFKEDPTCNRLLSLGKCMGCFYIESPAMRLLLGKLQCRDYLTLVAASSIIRPGVARSGMMREYIYRHHNPGQFEYIHPKMGELMQETHGVMVYQEDVIKVAHHFAGLDLAEADILRRGMSGKFRSRAEFARVEQKFFDNCRERKYPEAITTEVWRQIESFSGYSFSKAHSASYAVESYQSLYLKAYYPLEFMVGVINNFGGFYRTEFYFHEARMWGANIEAPCVNAGHYLTSITGNTIYVGFIHLKSLSQKIGEQIPEERMRSGSFVTLQDFVERIPIGLEQLNILIKVGAFRFTNMTKRELLWEARLLFARDKSLRHGKSMFESPVKKFTLPTLDRHPLEDAFDELELLEFPLCDPFQLLKTDDLGNITAAHLADHNGKRVEIAGYLVTTKNTHTKDRKLMHFGTFLDREGNFFDTTHFPPVAKKFPFRGKGFYRLKGKVVTDFDYPMIEIDVMDKLPMQSRRPEVPELVR